MSVDAPAACISSTCVSRVYFSLSLACAYDELGTRRKRKEGNQITSLAKVCLWMRESGGGGDNE